MKLNSPVARQRPDTLLERSGARLGVERYIASGAGSFQSSGSGSIEFVKLRVLKREIARSIARNT